MDAAREHVRSDLLTAQELMQQLQLSRDAIYRGARSGRIPGAMKVLGQLRFDAAAIDEWLRNECSLIPAATERRTRSAHAPSTPHARGSLGALIRDERGEA